MTRTIFADSTKAAWDIAAVEFPTDWERDEQSTERAGYDVYRSAASGYDCYYICDLGNELELNLGDEGIVYIQIKDEPGAAAESWTETEVVVSNGLGELRKYENLDVFYSDWEFWDKQSYNRMWMVDAAIELSENISLENASVELKMWDKDVSFRSTPHGAVKPYEPDKNTWMYSIWVHVTSSGGSKVYKWTEFEPTWKFFYPEPRFSSTHEHCRKVAEMLAKSACYFLRVTITENDMTLVFMFNDRCDGV